MIHELSTLDLRRICGPKSLPDETGMDPGQAGPIIGQERAVRAMQFGLDIQSWGFNIYVAGMAGTGRATAVDRFVEEIAATKPTPKDWCYVYNFEDSYRPRALSLPAGKAREFQRYIMAFLKIAIRDIHMAFEKRPSACRKSAPRPCRSLWARVSPVSSRRPLSPCTFRTSAWMTDSSSEAASPNTAPFSACLCR